LNSATISILGNTNLNSSNCPIQRPAQELDRECLIVIGYLVG